MARTKGNEAVKEKIRKPKKSTELAIALPGADSIDSALLDQVVANLNQLYAVKGLETARAVAESVIQFFFAGNVENFHDRHGSHLSFRELAKREDLRVTYQFVWNSCAVVDQLRMLPPDVANALPMSHHKMLLPIKDTSTKQALAKVAVDDGLTKRQFEVHVKKARAELKADSNAGRPPLPAFAKAFGKVRRIVEQAQSEDVGEHSFTHYSKEDARELLLRLEQDVAVLSSVAARVRELVAS